ncbi:MAG: TonB-dependent receptor [Taibaiella sp.]|jgi:hypothetical protein
MSKNVICFGLLVIVSLWASAVLNAQPINSITGKVVNVNYEPLIGNVAVLSATDSAFITGTSFQEADFELSGINQKVALLKFTSLAFSDTIIKVEYKGQEHIDLGSIIFSETRSSLDEVQVTAQAPMVRYRDNGNVEVNVSNTILARSNSVNEILSRSPNITIDEAGQVFVLGKGEAIIYLNNKRISREQMSAIPTSQISRIEIISNPSARYDAEGKAVINILTKMNMQEGMLGTLSQHITVSSFGGTHTNTLLDVSYTKGRFSLIGNYGLLLGKSREFLHTTRTRPEGSDYMSSDLTIDWRRKFNNYSNFGFGAQYNISEGSYISLGYSGYMENQGGEQHSENAIITNTEKGSYSSDLRVDQMRWNHSATFNFNKTLDTLGSAFFMGSQYSYFDGDTDDSIDEHGITNGAKNSRYLNNNTNTKISILTTQIDYTKVFNDRNKLDMGIKFSYVNDRSGTDFLVAEDGEQYKLDKGMSNNFRYTEEVPAAYINYSGSISGRIDFSLGTRGELTHYNLNTSSGGGQVIQKSYFNIFPNLLLSTTFYNVKLRASYASRITRPRYQALNPYIIYQDRFTSIQGSPDLVPEKTHAFEAGLNYKKYDFRMGYNFTLDPMTAAALRGDSANSYVLRGINLDKSHSFFVSLSKSATFKWWTSLNTATLRYSKSVDTKYDYVFTESRPDLYLYTSNTFDVNNLFKIQLLVWYQSNRYYGRFENQRSSVTLGIEKNFFKNVLKLSLTANDIFHNTHSSGTYDVGQTLVFYDRTYNTNYFRFIATFNFGKLKKSNYNIKSTGQDENSRAN